MHLNYQGIKQHCVAVDDFMNGQLFILEENPRKSFSYEGGVDVYLFTSILCFSVVLLLW